MSDRVYYSEEARRNNQQKQTMMVFAAIVLGAGIGAIMALLFAPQEGDEIREEIRERFDALYNQGRSYVNEATNNARDGAEHVRDNVKEVYNR